MDKPYRQPLKRARSWNGEKPESLISKLPREVKNSFLKKNPSQEKIVPFALPELIKKNSFLNEQCVLCQQYHSKSQMVCIANCQHIFCSFCLHRYCIYKINVMEDVTCPQEGCMAVLQTNNKVYQQLPQESKKRYSRNILWKQTINNPNLKLCPHQNCQGTIDKSKEVFQCNKCHTKYCKNCQLGEHKGACEQNFQSKFKDWKRCPQCHIFIERSQGCNHMTCRCSHEFCYVCLADWQEEHYECGPNNLDAQIAEISCLQRFFYGILIILGFPIYVGIFVALWGLSIVLGTLAGFLVGACMIYAQLPCAQNIICGLFCPVFMGIGAVFGALTVVFGGIYVFATGCKLLIVLLKMLWCHCQNPPQQPQFDNQLLEN